MPEPVRDAPTVAEVFSAIVGDSHVTIGDAMSDDYFIDIVMPRASVPEFMQKVSEVGQETQPLIVGCGHAGDGNVHMGIFQPDDEKRAKVRKSLLGHLNSGVTVCLK
jgi:FAD/FMN-containing dehydrogenase